MMAHKDHRLNALLAVLMLLCALVFFFWPTLDIAVSQVFYRPGHGFEANQLPWVKWVYAYTQRIGLAWALLCLLLWVMGKWWSARISISLRRTSMAVFLVALLGAGLLVDQVIKPGWSRPRPVHVDTFDGPDAFRSPWQPCIHCSEQYSFVSGHATAGFVLMAVGVCATPRRRRQWLLAAVALGGFIGGVRIAQGAHFLSDVIFSFFAVWLSTLLVSWLVERYGPGAGLAPDKASD